MKIKSKLLAHQEAVIQIEIGSHYCSKNHLTEENIHIENTGIEEIKSRHLITNGMVLLDTQMYFTTPQTIIFEIDEESVVMNFICCNNVETYIDNLDTEKFSKENTHNIFYTHNYKATYKIPAFEQINYLSIILSKDFYSTIINEDWELHEKFSKNILLKKSSYLTSKYIPFTPAIQWIIHEIKVCNRHGALKKMYLEAKIKELLIHQLETIIPLPKQKDHIDEDDYNKLAEAKEILEKDYVHAPTLTELSRLISLNEFKLKKGFKACFGTTVKSYIIKLRMEHAKKLFQNKSITVSEAAYKCGYKDVSHFSAAFKSFYGFSPQKIKINWDVIRFWISGIILLS
ncbi:transcriptional regulator, AraC family [Flavobacterium aquidurense]|uniref:DNA-binding protein n=1 Tax=Flavobacterium frigidimaris TaxID=262320 RepID=A0ABX4BPW1_FLAFR|nr:AraC family transcriptional regulator [Flavobacterium frigidimaris]OXA78544.1 DNA-binding protein [Flavobacterium frigidimaris]SDZ56780.1 transcriptional regulator, AraC family [Flavobacterium aquidurense]